MESLPPAATSVELRLDALIRAVGRLEAVVDRMAPVAPPEPADGETVELREPAPESDGAKPRRRR